MGDCLGIFNECKFCTDSSEHEACNAERRIFGGIMVKLNREEKIMLAQLFGKAREAGGKDMLKIICTIYKKKDDITPILS